jgi:hypothetical protein
LYMNIIIRIKVKLKMLKINMTRLAPGIYNHGFICYNITKPRGKGIETCIIDAAFPLYCVS